MKKQFRTILLLLLCSATPILNAQMTIVIYDVPQLTPLLDDIFVAGSFNNWTAADEAFKLTHSNNTWSISINGNENESIEFKFMRNGGWSMVEGNASGAYIPNRSLVFHNGTTQTLNIAGWEDIAGTHTVTHRVRILDTDFAIPQLERTRRIWISLPLDYEISAAHYPVIYMHDGQNLFDAATSFSGEWNVDETMIANAGPPCLNAIVVGIDNGGASRIDEYSPWLNTQYNEGGEGSQYADFIVQTLKPFIDNYFRTIPDREHTATAGSSLGALISIYLIARNNDVFSKAGIFSPAFWFNTEIYDYVNNVMMNQDTRIYFVCGDAESTGMVPGMQQMYDIVSAQSIPASFIQNIVMPGGQHNEYYWSQQFQPAIISLFPCFTSVTENPHKAKLRIYPNPAKEFIQFELEGFELLRIEILDAQGKILRSETMNNKRKINVGDLRSGTHHMRYYYRVANSDVQTQSDTTTFIIR